MAFPLPSRSPSLDLKVPINIYKAVRRVKLLATSQVCVPDPGILSVSTQLGPVHINASLGPFIGGKIRRVLHKTRLK